MRRQHFLRGDIIFAEGDPSAYAYVIDSGKVEIYQLRGDERVVLGTLGGGEIFGEMGLVDERPRSAHARVLEDAFVSAVTPDEFIELLFESPEQGMRYLRALFERLRSMNERVGQSELRDSQLAPEARVQKAPRAAVVLHAASERVGTVLPERGLAVERWPYRVGRVGAMLGDNDLELYDDKPYNLSRHHFVIARWGDGYVVRDRGSYLGTIVNGERIGGKRHNGEVKLNSGDNTVIAGDTASPFRFRIHVAT